MEDGGISQGLLRYHFKQEKLDNEKCQVWLKREKTTTRILLNYWTVAKRMVFDFNTRTLSIAPRQF